ncbi:mitogen-activated protein kinase 9 isoform X2 [Carica papaya]|uniref:mitogen-activated protein kinase 9 isoform X2 n=1 Tax=Carica papaya TaxID=3649 RepID=UPI000B8C79FD|nr:mitogen-activated protein kinase 9 isoform X2 [Carica papaya]
MKITVWRYDPAFTECNKLVLESCTRLCLQEKTSQQKIMFDKDFFTEYGEASRYEIQEVVGKGSYGVVASAIDTHTGEKVAIKKMSGIFERVSDATRILREIKLLRLLRHPDIVEIKHIMLPPCRKEFKDIYVVFELMESDLHHVIKVNDDLTPAHHQFFLYQLLRALKYIHTAHVFHRDIKPKNILANADCKLKICDFGLARPSFTNAPSAIFWTDYVATRWYRAPELCGSFFSNIRNEKARIFLNNMRKKPPIPFSRRFPDVDPLALRLLERLVAFDPKDRPTAEEALADPYFRGLANLNYEPSRKPISKLEFEFERRKLTKEDVRELIYKEILEYHPHMLQEYLQGADETSFMYPSGVDQFKQQFAYLEEDFGKSGKCCVLQRKYASLPRERVCSSKDGIMDENSHSEKHNTSSATRASLKSPAKLQELVGIQYTPTSTLAPQKRSGKPKRHPCLFKSNSFTASTCGAVIRKDREVWVK